MIILFERINKLNQYKD